MNGYKLSSEKYLADFFQKTAGLLDYFAKIVCFRLDGGGRFGYITELRVCGK
jgi:hypothetical protein